MAVLGRLVLGSSERLDLADALSIDSFTAADFKYLLKSFVGGDTPYILRGFDVNNPADAIGSESVSINIHDSVVYHPSAAAGAFYYGLEEGNEYAQQLIPELRKNATNFVYLTFTTFDTAQDSRAFWDPDQSGGEGSEFSQDVNTESVLTVEVGVSVATFPVGSIPICKIIVNASVIENIQDCRDMFFRLGTGGVSPNPFNDYDFRSLPTSTYERSEPSTSMSSATDPNPFQGGDKNIYTMKEWMNVVMTKLKELGGTTFWYESASGGGGGGGSSGGISTTMLKSKGKWIHSAVTEGQISWTEDINSISLIDPRSIIFRANSITLDDNQVAYAELINGVDINPSGDAVVWVNGGSIVAGAAGRFQNLSVGDWIKKKTDSDSLFLRVEAFYKFADGSGGTTIPATAASIQLSGAYQGTDDTATAEYTKGEYDTGEITIVDRDDPTLQSLSGEFFWLAARSDTVQSISSIVTTSLTIDITEADGEKARCTSSAAHGLNDEDRVTITTGGYTGTYKCEVVSTTEFFIDTTITGDESGINALYAIVTTGVKDSDYGYELESANHNFENDQTVIVTGTADHDGSYLIRDRSDTSFQIPVSASYSNPGASQDHIVYLPKVHVRTEFGITDVVQGESFDIGGADSDVLMAYIGMLSNSTSAPDYSIPSSYNALQGYENFNSSPSDNLTQRVAKLTAMMADRVQDREIKISNVSTIISTTNGGNKDITASSQAMLVKPGSPTQMINLTCSLATNKVGIINIGRNSSTALTISVEDLNTSFLLEENKFVMFYRFSTDDVYSWDGRKIVADSESHTVGENTRENLSHDQDRTAKLIAGGTWHWNLANEELSISSDAYIQIPGIDNNRNTLSSGSYVLESDELLICTINRSGSGATVVSSATTVIGSINLEKDSFIVARRIGDNVIVDDSFLLKDGEYLELDGALAEINRLLGQHRLTINLTNNDQIDIAGTNIDLLDGASLSQEINTFIVDFSGANVDFTTGAVTGPSGTSFTPSASVGEYFWYGIGLSPASVGSTNKSEVTVEVSTASSGHATQSLAPLPNIPGIKKLGAIQVYNNAGTITVEKILRLSASNSAGNNSGAWAEDAKLIKGGTWRWDLASTTLSWSSDAYIQVPGILDTTNRIVAGNDSGLTADGRILRLELKRSGVNDILPIDTAINGFVPTDNTHIMARRVGDNVLVGNSFLLKDGEMLELDGALAEINRQLNQLRMTASDTDVDEINIAGVDITQLDNTLLSQEISSFILEFTGANVNFTTGAVTGVLDSNFTPQTPATNEYFWYGIGLIPSVVDPTDNRMSAKMLITKASSTSAVQADAPLPIVTGTKKLGAIQIHWDGSDNVSVVQVRRFGVSGGGSGGGSVVKADLYEPIATSLPVGVSVTIDGITGANGDLVLFSNLASGNNRIYELSGVGSSLVWTAWPSFNGLFDPVDGDAVRFERGDAFGDQLALFNGNGFVVNDVVRFFDGESGTDFWELGSIKTAVLSDNTSSTEVFSVNATGSENIIVSYSILRGTNKQVGDLYITHDGTNTSIAITGTDIGSCGITFSSDIDSGNIRLLYDSTSTGNDAVLKYFIRRWSDNPGGPTGVPNYTSATGSSSVAAAGSDGDVQYKGGTGNLAGDARFNWDVGSGFLNLNGIQYGTLSSPIVLNDNVGTPTDISTMSWDSATNRFILIEYSLERDGDTQMGHLRLTNNTVISSLTDDFLTTAGGTLGITFTALISGSNVKIRYTSTSTGINTTFKYSIRKWN